ncbi:hypothetical protein LINPERHAP2_LOCUS19247 [Linum perenne]
MSRLIINNM